VIFLDAQEGVGDPTTPRGSRRAPARGSTPR
jgi:hypothetical protein